MRKIKDFIGWKEVTKKQRIGLLLAILYWITVFIASYFVHVCITDKIISARGMGIGGELFNVPVFLVLTYIFYNNLVVKKLKKYMYH